MNYNYIYEDAIENLVSFLRSKPKNKAIDMARKMLQDGHIKLDMYIELEKCVKYPNAEVVINIKNEK